MWHVQEIPQKEKTPFYPRSPYGVAKLFGDYIQGMWLMLQQDKPEDYLLSTNESHSVKEFVEKAFVVKGFDIKWKGDVNTGRELIFISDKYFRAAEVDLLIGDSTKARTELGWSPKVTFDELVKEMVENDCQ